MLLIILKDLIFFVNKLIENYIEIFEESSDDKNQKNNMKIHKGKKGDKKFKKNVAKRFIYSNVFT